MTTLAIVEDQDFIREAIRSSLDWKSIDIELCGSYANGKQALDGFAQTMPDIVLSDIRMPIIDGLEMLRQIHDNEWNTQVIILSGFDDFKYAQEALKYHAVDFLLKPCKPEDLEQSIVRIRNKIEKEAGNKEISSIDMSFVHDKEQKISYANMPYLLNMARKNDLEELKKALEKFLLEIDVRSEEHGWRQNWFSFFIFSLNNRCLSSGQASEQILAKNMEILRKLMQTTEISVCSRLLAEAFCTSMAPCESSKAVNFTIDSALTYIKTHYNEDLSLDAVATHVFLSKNYLSTLFKQTQGVNFTDYLNNIRIEKAQELLKTTNKKISDISTSIGYTNYRYFNYQFYKATGKTPTEYRYAFSSRPK
ncbi:response regulator [Lachnospiraceae bacterium ZAX-1]